MEKAINKLKEELERKNNLIKLKGEISGATWVEMSIKNTMGDPVTLGTPFNELKFRSQILFSGAHFSQGYYRIDNSHGFPHQHYENLISPIDTPTLSGALLMIFGSEYYLLEK